jgi:glutathione S-transferase
MITIYHVPHSRSMRVVWLMEELGEEYRIEPVAFPTPEDYRAISPLGTVPAIDDASVPGGVRMFESIAILQYLTGVRLVAGNETAAALTVGPKPDQALYAEHLTMLHFGEADLAAACTSMAMRKEGSDDAIPEHRRARLAGRLAFLDQRLADGREWITGTRFTIADISIGYALGFAAFLGLAEMFGPNLAAYWQRLQARPAFQRAAVAA